MKSILMTRVTKATLSCLLLLIACASVSSDEPDFAAVNAVMKANKDTITSGKGDIKITSTKYSDRGRETSIRKLQVAFSGERVRIKSVTVQGNLLAYEAAYNGAEQTLWMKNMKISHPVIITGKLTDVLYGDYVQYLQPGAYGYRYFNDDAGCTLVRDDTLDPKIIVLAAPAKMQESSEFAVKFWVDTTKGYLTTKTELTAKRDGALASRAETVVQLRQDSSGVWVPRRLTRTWYAADGTKTEETTAEYAPSFSFNSPVPLDEFAVDLPQGIEVRNEILDARYQFQ